MDVSSEQLVFMYGELAVENRLLRNQLEALQAQIIALSEPKKKVNTVGGGNDT